MLEGWVKVFTEKNLYPVDSTVHVQCTVYFVKTIIHWIRIYLLDSVISSVNNWVLAIMRALKSTLKDEYAKQGTKQWSWNLQFFYINICSRSVVSDLLNFWLILKKNYTGHQIKVERSQSYSLRFRTQISIVSNSSSSSFLSKTCQAQLINHLF